MSPQTEAERFAAFWAFREPDLRFGLPMKADLTIDAGVPGVSEPCCRYAHHRTCPSLIVGSVVGVRYWLREDGGHELAEHQLAPYQIEGDLLAEFGQLMAVVRTQHATVASTVRIMSDLHHCPLVVEMIEVGVWCLTRDEQTAMRAIWSPPEQEEEEASALPLAYLDPEDEEATAITSSPDYLQVELYAEGETVLPSEIGRDRERRYLSARVVDAPDSVNRMTIKEAAVHVRLADGTETDLMVKARYTGQSEEPLDMSFTALTPRGEASP